MSLFKLSFLNITGLNIKPFFSISNRISLVEVIGTLCSFLWQTNISWSYVVLQKKKSSVLESRNYDIRLFAKKNQFLIVLPEKNGCWVQISHEIHYSNFATKWFGDLRLSKMKRAPSIYREMYLTQKVKILSFVGLP